MDRYQDLSELRRKISSMAALEAKKKELTSQRAKYYSEITSLRVLFRQEQEDVDKLEGKSLANYFFQVIGKLDEKLDQQRQEAYAAKVKLDLAERELAGIERDMDLIQGQLIDILVMQDQYQLLLQRKRNELKSSGTSLGDQIIGMEEEIFRLEAQKQEIREAISAGNSARSIADRVLKELDDADDWNTWDMFGGGGVITHLAKHSHLDDAQDLISQLQSQLRRFKTELSDIQIDANVQVNVEGFLRFADYFFDGLFVDWAVGDKISRSKDAVSHTKSQINRLLNQLREMEKSLDQELEKQNHLLDEWIIDV